MSILIFGSINLDLVTRTPRLPQTGETLTGHSFTTIPGGKGANQAVAVARLGVSAEMVGRLGNDRFGQELLASLRAAGVGCDRIQIDASTSSGIAVIAVGDRGENHIIIVPGANGQVGSEDVDRLRSLLPEAKALLLQLEIPQSAVMAAATAAKQANVPVILDPAPAPAEFYAELYRAIDIITPNQTEASALVGFMINSLADATQAAQVLHQRGIATVIIKLGNQGAFCSTLQAEVKEQFLMPAFAVEVVDTVAAGDAFNGGLAVALAEGYSLREAVHWASGVAALSVTKAGAQPSLPTRQEVEKFMAEVAEVNPLIVSESPLHQG